MDSEDEERQPTELTCYPVNLLTNAPNIDYLRATPLFWTFCVLSSPMQVDKEIEESRIGEGCMSECWDIFL